ncbi:MAG: alpha/beta fold hydrolase [Saprospiraceae bacterium]|nr:alpha/beta fold hydrolase [Saprospiraceae bacterium]
MKNLLLFLCIPLMILSCQSGDSRSAPSGCDFLSGLPESENITCGYVTVPENHAQPEGRKLRIAYAILPAKDTAASAYPVIYFMGGPGGRVLDNLEGWLDHPLRQKLDIILFDQRGLGHSSPLPDMTDALSAIQAADLDKAEERQQTRLVVDSVRRRAAGQGIQLQYYNTDQNAHDVAVLMEELGYEKYNLFGGSYGTRLAREVMEQSPEYVRAAVLAAPAVFESDFLTSRMENYRDALQLVFEHCRETPECREKYPDLQREYLEAVHSLNDDPLAVRVAGKEFVVNPQDALYMLRYQLYTGDSRERVPVFIRALRERDIETISSTQAFLEEVQGLVNNAMFLSVVRYEEYDTTLTAAVLDSLYAVEPLFPAHLAHFDPLYLAAREWHNGHATYEQLHWDDSPLPALISVNKYDPVTPAANGYAFKETLPNATLLVLDEGGHSGGGACQLQLLIDFFTDPQATLDTSCLNLVEE